jgi:hypothetical protein
MATFIDPDYETRTIGKLTQEVCGDYIDFGGSFFAITQADQPGFLTVTGDDYHTFEIAYQDVCAAIDTELIVRREAGS